MGKSPAQPPKPNSMPEADGLSRKGTLHQLQIAFGVAFLLATLFTAWTPGQFNSNRGQQGIGISILATASPVLGEATITPRGPLRIGIVAGHWKNDPGAVCEDGLKEVNVNLNIASLVQKSLSDQGYQVDLLYEFDPRLLDYQASALVSIHADSCRFINNEATGFKVAAAMATRYPERAARLTACLRSRYNQATNLGLHSTSVTTDMTLYHAFDEINENTPAAIIETGFLNLNRELLTGQPDLVAKGIVNGIICYIKNESITTLVDQPTIEQAGTPTTPPANQLTP